MLPRKKRQSLYALFLLSLSVVCTTAIANEKVYTLIAEVVSVIDNPSGDSNIETAKETLTPTSSPRKIENKTKAETSASIFMTIIQGADDTAGCSDNGFTVARFNLCGDFDDRTISLSGGPYSSVSWQRLDSCTPDINENCPNTTNSCYLEVGTGQTLNLDASGIDASLGAEYVVEVDGQPYYFKVKKNAIDLDSSSRDFTCGVPGRIQLLGLPSGYEYSIDGGASWQTLTIFDDLAPGDYNVITRLEDTPGACEYPYETITIEEKDIEIDVVVTDAICFGENGSIRVDTGSSVQGPYRYTLLDGDGNAQEFTSFISDDFHVFSAVAFGTYSVQVETPQCSGNASLGITPPQQSLDTSGNPIVIGDGLTQITATAEHTQSLSAACGVNSIDITLNVSGGVGPYTYTVSGDATTYGPITGSDSYTVTAAGTYEFTILDVNLCPVSVSDPVEEITTPDVTVAGVNGTCTNGGARLEFNVIDAKGYTLSFRADSSDPWSTSTSLSVAAGTYDDVQVRYQLDTNDCILQLTPPLPDIIVTNDDGVDAVSVKLADQTCAVGGGTNGGSIEVNTPTGGSGSYEYSIDGVNFSTVNTFTDLLPGSYTTYIRDVTNPTCVRELTLQTIETTDPPTNLDFTFSNLDCLAGTVSVTVSETANFAISTYEIISPTSVDNGTDPLFPGLVSGTTYTFRITDVNNCTYEESYIPIVESTVRARVKSGGDRRVCPSESDGSGAFLVDGFFADTPGLDYDYEVNFSPASGGASSLFTSGSSSDLEIPITGLSAGTYEIAITDNDTNCTATTSFDVEEPTALSLNGTVTSMSCQNNNTGRVEAIAGDGFGSYRYELEWPGGLTQGPKSNRFFSGLTDVGEYILTVTDSEGCSAEFRFTLEEVDAPSISLATADLCYSAINDGSITVNSTVGTGDINDHQYRINGGALQTPGTPGTHTFSGLVPGSYTVEVVNVVTNCSEELPVVVVPGQVRVNLGLETEIGCNADGEMRITVLDGLITDLSMVSYDIVYDDGVNPATSVESGTGLPANPYDFSIAGAGSYTVSITDNNGCFAVSESLTFAPPTTIAATHRIVGPSCLDSNSGFVEIIPTVSSGVPPFEVVFAPAPTPGVLTADPNNPNAGGTTFTFSDQTIYSGLSAGFYEYVVKDDRNCLTGVTRIEVIDDPILAPDAAVSATDAICNPGGDVFGGISIDGIANGVPEYTYIIEDYLGNEITRLTADGTTTYPIVISDATIIPGNYQIITLDSRGCRDIDVVTVGTSTVTIVPDNSSLPVICTPGGFTYCVDIVGGVGPFDIRLIEDPLGAFISLGGTPPTPVRNHCFPNVQFGESFIVEVRDNDTGCVYQEVISVPDEPSGTLDVDLTIDNATCIPGNLVDLTYTITGATGNLDIEITNLETGAIFISETRTNATFTYQVPEGEYGILIVDDGTDCSGGDTAVAILNMPRVDVIENISANCNALGQLTIRGSGGEPFTTGSPYFYAFVPTGSPVDTDGTLTPTDSSDDFSDATTVSLPGSLAPGISYDIWVRDSRNCEFMTSAAIVQLNPDLPSPTINVNNQCDVTIPSGGFTITVEMPASVDTPTFTLNGITQTPAYDSSLPTQATFSVNSIGTYPVYIIDANGCDVEAEAEVFQVLSASGDFTTEPTCTNPDGTITVNANGGSGDFTFQLQDNLGTPIGTINSTGIFTNVSVGEYQVLVTDNLVMGGIPIASCSFLVENIIRSTPTAPVISDIGKIDISCRDVNDGSINVGLVSNTDIDGIKEYNLYRYSGVLPVPLTETPISTNTTGSFDSLDEDTYVIEVVSDRDCVDQEQFDIDNPNEFEISWPAVSFACETGANRFSTATIVTQIEQVGNGAPYRYKLDPDDSYQTSGTFEIIDNGTIQTITVYAIDASGCESQFTRDIPLPTEVNGIISQVSPMSCTDPERIQIDVTGTTDFTIVDMGTSIAAVADVVVTGASSRAFDLPMQSGVYRLQINDTGGCTYAIAEYTVVDPTPPNVILTEAQRVTCSTTAVPGSNGQLSIEITDYVTPGAYEYQLFSIDTGGAETALGSPVALNTSTNPETISGLSGGNYRVDITTTDGSECPASSNVVTIRTPIPLAVTAVLTQEPGCSNDFGQIEATGFGGWTSIATPYEYQLRRDDGSLTYPTIVEAFTTNGLFEDLPAGDYRVEIRDEEGCPAFDDLSVTDTPEIQAEIREPSGLVCPGDNNAVLEVYDPRTGDATTATTGVSGGVLNAGYKLRLLYLNSDDVDADGNPTDIRETGGFQDPFVFTGSSGGTIGAGWYAIEVESFGCPHITAPYLVVAPPPLMPNLDLVQVPGCGGDGIMRLRVENGDTDPSVVYEFIRDSDLGSGLWQDMDEDGNTAITLSRPADVNAYVYLVREKGSACSPISSDGINLTDATAVELFVETPDDVSCAFELDGRIEYSAIQGLGVYEFTLYQGNPGTDAYNPNSSATILSSSTEDGAFEGLGPATDYYIGVTSGTANCGSIEGPFEIINPDPIEVDSEFQPVTCYGLEDGSIRMEVISGGEGLLQFAIGPNFGEFFSDPDTPGVYVFEDLPAGSYEVWVQDDRCTEKRTVEVSQPDELVIYNIDTTPEGCLNDNDGTVVFNIEGGTPFEDPLISSSPYYEYKIEMSSPVDELGTGVFVPYDGSVIENLQGGATYVIFVQDANLCPTSELFTVDIGVDLTAVSEVQYGCEGIFPNSTSRIVVGDQSLMPDLLLYLEDLNSLDPPLTEEEMIDLADVEFSWGDLPASSYRAHIFYEGCSIFVDFDVEAYEPLTLEAIKTAPNEITASADGGYGGYEFFFQGESVGEETVYTTNESTMVNIRVVDERGCEAFVTIPFEFTGMIDIPNFFTPDGDSLNDVWAPNNREFFPNIDVKIYDRYGRVVAELNQITSWDGKYEDNELPTGDYWYVVNANDKTKQRYVGHFTLYR